MTNDCRIDMNLRLPFLWDCIEPARQSVIAVATAALSDPALAERMGIAVSELLENAIKHGREHDIWLTLKESAGKLVAMVRNAVHPGTESTAALSNRLEWMAGYADPRDAYLAAMTAVYEQTDPSASSSQSTIGLVRIAHEGNCRIECDLSEPGYVTMNVSQPIGTSDLGNTDRAC